MSDKQVIWADDLLDRQGDADFLESYIAAQVKMRLEQGTPGSFALNIDADWGAGKTFFVDRFARQLELSGHIVARVNAWRDDYLDDPFVAVLASIDAAIAPFIKKDGRIQSAWKGVKKGAIPVIGRVASGVAKTVVRKYVGKEIGELLATDPNAAGDEDDQKLLGEIAKSGGERVTVEIENVIDQSTQKIIDSFNGKRKAAENFQSRLATAVDAIGTNSKGPFYIIVDELDRCRPSYAVALLERVKHLFSAPNIVFVFATNADQLKYSITGQYGVGFDGFKYLKRFFEATYKIAEPDLSKFLENHAERVVGQYDIRAPGGDTLQFMRIFFSKLKLPPRDVKRIVKIVEDTASVWRHQSKIDLAILLPLATSFYLHGTTDWAVAHKTIPNDLAIDIPASRSTGRQAGEMNISSLFARFVEINRSRTDFKKALDSETKDINTEYIANSIHTDWERVMNGGRRTSYNDLAVIVAHAGSLVAQN